MSACGCEIEAESAGQRRILTIALVLNAIMFVIGFIAGIANLAVLCAALVVRWTAWDWIDLVVGGLIAIYVIKEAFEILATARRAAHSRRYD